jgi:hypothetical protein
MPRRFHGQLAESIAETASDAASRRQRLRRMIVTSESTRLQWSLPPLKSNICSITLSEHLSQQTIGRLALSRYGSVHQCDEYREACTYFKVYFNDLSKSFLHLRRTVSRGEARKCELRQHCPILRIGLRSR